MERVSGKRVSGKRVSGSPADPFFMTLDVENPSATQAELDALARKIEPIMREHGYVLKLRLIP